jgi:hypothetical protein
VEEEKKKRSATHFLLGFEESKQEREKMGESLGVAR